MRIKVYHTERGRLKFVVPQPGEKLAAIVYYPPAGGKVVFRGIDPKIVCTKVIPAFGDRVDESDLFEWWMEWVREWD